jgi:hypothetical protein
VTNSGIWRDQRRFYTRSWWVPVGDIVVQSRSDRTFGVHVIRSLTLACPLESLSVLREVPSTATVSHLPSWRGGTGTFVVGVMGPGGIGIPNDWVAVVVRSRRVKRRSRDTASGSESHKVRKRPRL